MLNLAAWSIFVLGALHIPFGIVRFKAALAGVFADGFIGQFTLPEARRSAFWFIAFGPMVMLAGHLSIHAVATSDLQTLRLIGVYLFCTLLAGAAAFPRSPMWVPVLPAAILMAGGFGLIA